MHYMRKVGLVLVGVLIVGALGLQVGLAAEPQADTLVVCQRPGTDLRSPAANGTCPSGYTKTEITEAPPTAATAYHAEGALWSGSDLAGDPPPVVILTLPAGAYTVVASGEVFNAVAGVSIRCRLVDESNEYEAITLTVPPGATTIEGTMIGAFSFSGTGPMGVGCTPPTGTGVGTTWHQWRITATPVEDLIIQ